MDISQLQTSLAASSEPPETQWDPPFCGDINIHIRHDGSWHYLDSPIHRPALVQLFARVLRFEQPDYFLVTPVEKVRIKVDDVPFVLTQWQTDQGKIIFSTQTDEPVILGPAHPMELRHKPISGEWVPYCLVRQNLWARMHRNIFYQLIEIAEADDAQRAMYLTSGNYRACLGHY